MKKPYLPSLCALLTALALTAALAQTPAKNDAVFRYRGADRDARLLQNAKQEGTVVLYTSLAPTESKPLAEAFEKKYGLKVELWRALSDKVVQRVVTEAQAKRFTVDVVETNGPEMEMLARERLLAEFHSPHIADLPPAAIPPHRTWFPDRMNYFVVGYNTAKVQRSEIPATYEGFTDPKWKGRIGIEATDAEWMATLIKTWGDEKGMDYFRKLAAMKPDVRKGHVLLAELVAAGEVPVGLTMYNSNIESLKRKGAPIDFVPVAAGGRAPPGHRRREERAAPARGALVRRFRALPRRPEAVRIDGPRAREHQGEKPPQQLPLHADRARDRARGSRQVGPALG